MAANGTESRYCPSEAANYKGEEVNSGIDTAIGSIDRANRQAKYF